LCEKYKGFKESPNNVNGGELKARHVDETLH